MNTTNQSFRNALLAVLLISAWLSIAFSQVFAQTVSADEPDDLRSVIELLRSDINTFKVRTINQALALTSPEAEVFWPIYRAYEKELAAVADKKINLIREFVERSNAGTFDDKAADRLAQSFLKNARDRIDLWAKYQKKIAKALSASRAAQFLQVEHQIALFIDLNIAAEMPALRLVGGAKEK